jgi:hypothetical protein
VQQKKMFLNSKESKKNGVSNPETLTSVLQCSQPAKETNLLCT